MPASLDLTLTDLPVRDALTPMTHAGMAKFLDDRHAACLRIAENTLTLADTVNSRGDEIAARDLIDEAKTYLVEAARIDAQRI